MKYMLTLVGPETDWGDITPEEARQNMARWDAYTAELREAGAMVAGEGLQESATATTVRFGAGGVEVAEDADQGRDRPSRLAPEQAVDLIRVGGYGATSSLRCSVEPPAAS